MWLLILNKVNNHVQAAEKISVRFFSLDCDDNNFTFMGYRSYHITKVEGDMALSPDLSTSLGLMKNIKSPKQRLLSKVGASARELALGKTY